MKTNYQIAPKRGSRLLALTSLAMLLCAATGCLQDPEKLNSKASNLLDDEDPYPPGGEGGGGGGGGDGDWGGDGDTGGDTGDTGDTGDNGGNDGDNNSDDQSNDESNQSPGGTACRAACWGAAGLGCAAVSVACAVGDVVTIGGATIPCAMAIIAACTAASAGASVCSDYCPP